MKKLNLLFVLLIIMTSCAKEESCDCPIGETYSAAISIKIIDNNQQAVANATVEIFAAAGGSTAQNILDCTTGATGTCDAGRLLEGEYGYIVSSQVGNINYSVEEYFQVITGEDKTIEINPYSNVGTLKITIMKFDPVPNISVALIPHPNYANQEYDFNDLLAEAYFTGTTNDEGFVVFEDAPVMEYGAKVYSVLVYYNDTTWEYPVYDNSFYLYKDEESEITVHVNL